MRINAIGQSLSVENKSQTLEQKRNNNVSYPSANLSTLNKDSISFGTNRNQAALLKKTVEKMEALVSGKFKESYDEIIASIIEINKKLEPTIDIDENFQSLIMDHMNQNAGKTWGFCWFSKDRGERMADFLKENVETLSHKATAIKTLAEDREYKSKLDDIYCCSRRALPISIEEYEKLAFVIKDKTTLEWASKQMDPEFRAAMAIDYKEISEAFEAGCRWGV